MKKQVSDFLKKFKITELNLQTLTVALEQQGYTIVEYSRIVNSDDVEQLLDALGVKALSLTTGAFTYADKNHRIVFIEEGLSDEETLILLAHEQGHIFCGHMKNSDGIIGENVIKEQEANEFAHYLLKKSFFRDLKLYFSTNKVRTAIIAFIFVIIIAAAVTGGIIYNRNLHKDEYCRTRSGYHYHKPGCISIKDHPVTYDSKENYEKLHIEPCSICLPDLAK